MQPVKPIYLLTGQPGTGKTSLIKQVIAATDINAGGFYTEEIRIRNTRTGFKIVTLDGHEAILSHIDFSKRFQVGKYGVDLNALNEVGVTAMLKAVERSSLVVVDEIGRMELLSQDFRDTVQEIVDSSKRTLGTIMYNTHPFTDNIKRQPQVNLVTLNRYNYEETLKMSRNGWRHDFLRRIY
jgi:nucleoside-triphosphatase